MKKKRKQKQKQQKLNQSVEEIKPVEEIKKRFKKIVFLDYWAYGLDENHDLYSFDRTQMILFKSEVKNIFGCDNDGASIFGIDLNGKTFKNSIMSDYSLQYLDIDLKMEKMFVLPNLLFGNATDGNTYSFYFDTYRRNQIKTKLSYHFKKMTAINYPGYVNDQISSFRVLVAIDYHDEFYVWGHLPQQYKEKFHCLGKNPREQMIKLLDNKVINEVIDKVISELLYGKKEFVIKCSGKKIDAKMIYNTSDIMVAADRDGKIYFTGPEKNRFINVNTWAWEWSESPYSIKPKPKFTKRKQQDKLFSLLKNEKNCDLSLNFFFSSSSSSSE
jgi:hypothetical protein